MSTRAAIDVGSNSVKLLVLEIQSDGTYEILWDESRVTRLGRGISERGFLDPRSSADTLAALRDYAQRAQALGAEAVRVAGTAALRSADDGAGFINLVREELGLELEVLSGDDEARLSRVVALRELAQDFTPPAEEAADMVFFDVGGGSTELTWCRGEEILGVRSCGFGARRCAEVAGVLQPVTPQMHERLSAMIQTALLDDVPGPGGGTPVRLAGLGGTATALVWLLMGVRDEGISNPHGATVTVEEMDALLRSLAGQTIREVRGRRNLDPARADVIYAGITIIALLLAHYGAGEFILVDRGLRFGLLLA